MPGGGANPVLPGGLEWFPWPGGGKFGGGPPGPGKPPGGGKGIPPGGGKGGLKGGPPPWPGGGIPPCGIGIPGGGGWKGRPWSPGLAVEDVRFSNCNRRGKREITYDRLAEMVRERGADLDFGISN